MAGKKRVIEDIDPVVEDVLETNETETAFDESIFEGAETIVDSNTSEDIETVLSDITRSVDSLSGNTSSDAKVLVKTNSFNLTDKIPCKSLFHGKLIYTSPTNGSRYVWNEHGSVQHIPLVELETMNNHKPEILNKPLLLILEPKVAEDFNFGDVYKKVALLNKLGDILKTGDITVIKNSVRGLIDVGMRDSVIADIRKRRKENTLVDINVINMLKVELKCDIE